MSEQTLERVISQYLKIGNDYVSIGFQGGEPTLMGLEFFEKVVHLIHKYKRPSQQVVLALQTNGMLLDTEWAAFLKKNNFLVGLSIDGPASAHDCYRTRYDGSPTHEVVARNMAMLREQGVEFNTLTVVSKSNVHRAAEIFDYLQSNGSGYMQFIPCVEKDRESADGSIAAFSPTPGEYADFLCTIFDKWIGDGMPSCYVRFFDEMLISYVNYRSPSCYFAPYCVANLVVEHNGDIFPCDFFVEPDWYLGNINTKTMEEIAANPKLQRFILRKNEIDSRCRTCKWLPLCWGDCCKYRLTQEGRSSQYTYFCESYRHFFEYSQPKMLELKKKLLNGNDPRSSDWRMREKSIQRNDSCPCGSGLKFKKCCMPIKAL